MKYFDLIYGSHIKRAPKTKIIPAQEFSLLLNGKELLEKVQEDADRYKEEVYVESETLKERAEGAGFEAGLNEWATQLAHFEVHMNKIKAELEGMIVPVAIQAAKKIIGRELELDPNAIVDIVKQSLKAVCQHHRFVIYVNRADLAILDSNRPRLKEVLENVESLFVRERDDIAQGDCIIETEAGIINVKMEQIWAALERAFNTILQS